jgi:DNA-directed RNA polymerase subunit RPC12/RpoP
MRDRDVDPEYYRHDLRDKIGYFCPECGTELEWWDCGTYKNMNWDEYRCPDCGYRISNEPNLDI